MSFLSFIPIIGKALEKGLDIVDDLVEDKDKANELKAAIRQQVLIQQHDELVKELEAQSKIILAEAQGESAAQRNWRPHLMYFIMALMAFNGAVVPLSEAIFQVHIPTLEAWSAIPEQMWSVLMIGIGGYVAGRSAEKILKKD